jgi:negative regulator of flagellin synthesis FlgM
VRISNEQIQQILQTQGVKPKSGPVGASRVEGPQAADAAQFSVTGQEVTKALGVIAKQPAIRTERVEAIKAQIAAGTYQVSGADVARAILSRNLANDLQ